MKSLMRNIFCSAALMSIVLAAGAQRTATVAGTPARVAPSGRVTGAVTAGGYYFSDKQIDEKDLKSKEVSKEVNAPKGADIYIENSSRAIVVKTWDQPKVKVATTVYYDGESKLTDEEWLERVNLSLKTLGSSVKIKSGSPGGGFTFIGGQGYSYSTDETLLLQSTGQNIGSKSNMKRVVTITVPSGSKLDIESKYADVQLPAGVGDVNVDIQNGNLEADNLGKLILRSRYSNANVGDVKSAELEFNNGRFSAKNIDDLDVESKYSTIEMATAKKVVLRSTNDEYEIEEAGEVSGHKNYGNLRITKLNNSIDLDGANADVKVRNVGPSVSLIKIDNRYADVRIPLRNVKDYAVEYSGAYSSVYGNFEKVPVAEKEKEKTTTGGSASPAPVAADNAPITVAGHAYRLATTSTFIRSGEGNSPSHFTATVGSGKGLKVAMNCMNCTVDFK